jgi:hypothetical protein
MWKISLPFVEKSQIIHVQLKFVVADESKDRSSPFAFPTFNIAFDDGLMRRKNDAPLRM